jgi:hypothetical protein
MVAAATGSLAEAAAKLGVADAPAAARLTTTAGSVEVVWTQLAEATGHFVGPDAHTGSAAGSRGGTDTGGSSGRRLRAPRVQTATAAA